MPSTTTNYKFEKPNVDEFYDIEVQNRNWNENDTELKKVNDEISNLNDRVTNLNAVSVKVSDNLIQNLGAVSKPVVNIEDAIMAKTDWYARYLTFVTNTNTTSLDASFGDGPSIKEISGVGKALSAYARAKSIVLPLTSESDKGYVVTTNFTVYSPTTFTLYKLFDNDESTYFWARRPSSLTNPYIQIKIPKERAVNRIKLVMNDSYMDTSSSKYFEGSNNGTTWTRLLTATNLKQGANYFSFDNANTYLYYRLNFVDVPYVDTGTGYMDVGFKELYVFDERTTQFSNLAKQESFLDCVNSVDAVYEIMSSDVIMALIKLSPYATYFLNTTQAKPKMIAKLAGLNPDSYSSYSSLASDATAMDKIAKSTEALKMCCLDAVNAFGAFLQNPIAMNAFYNNVTIVEPIMMASTTLMDFLKTKSTSSTHPSGSSDWLNVYSSRCFVLTLGSNINTTSMTNVQIRNYLTSPNSRNHAGTNTNQTVNMYGFASSIDLYKVATYNTSVVTVTYVKW